VSARILRVVGSPRVVAEFASLDAAAREDGLGQKAYEELLELTSTSAWLLRCDCSHEVLGSLLLQQAADEVEVLFVGVRPSYRRRGFGEGLIRAGLAAATAEGARSAFLEVRASNVGALRLYEGVGFKTVGTRRGYYADGEDACVMMCSIQAFERTRVR